MPGRKVGLFLICGLVASSLLFVGAGTAAGETPGCQQVLSIFARGSSQEIGGNDARAFERAIRANIADTGIRFDSVELGDLDKDGLVEGGDYPAAPLEEWFGPTSIFDPTSDLIVGRYNASRKVGTDELVSFLDFRAEACPDETYVVGGYSQGADAVGAALPLLGDSARAAIGFVALFGDPQFNPRGRPLSFATPWARGDYPWYTIGGALGFRSPYIPDDMHDRVGSWCDREDPICTSNIRFAFDRAAHGEYPGFETLQAANEIAVKLREIRPELREGLKTTIIPISVRPSDNVDVTFVVDTTGSMGDDIDAAQASISQVTDALFSVARSPRVSLVDYKDEGDAYQAQVESPFTSDRAGFAAAVNNLAASGGGDIPESVYSGLMTAFTLDWRPGALKLAILIGDAPAKNPEPGTGHTLAQVLRTAFELDPVVINPIVVGDDTTTIASFTELASGSGGTVFGAADSTQVVRAIEEAIAGFSSAPVAQAGGPYTAAPGETLTFTGAGSFDPAGSIVNYAWDFDSDGTIDQQGDSPVATFAYSGAYSGLASLTVTSDSGRINVATAEISVSAGQQLPRVPGAPQSVRAATGDDGSVSLTWQPPRDPGDAEVDGYRVYQEGGRLLAIRPAAEPTLRIEGVPDGEAFYVEALNIYGAGPRTASDAASAGDPSVTPCVEATRNLETANATLEAMTGEAQAALGKPSEFLIDSTVAADLVAVVESYDSDSDGVADVAGEQPNLDESSAQLAAVRAALDAQLAVDQAEAALGLVDCSQPGDGGPGPGGGGPQDGEIGGSGPSGGGGTPGSSAPNVTPEDESEIGPENNGGATAPVGAAGPEFSQVGEVPVGAVDTGGAPPGSWPLTIIQLAVISRPSLLLRPARPGLRPTRPVSRMQHGGRRCKVGAAADHSGADVPSPGRSAAVVLVVAMLLLVGCTSAAGPVIPAQSSPQTAQPVQIDIERIAATSSLIPLGRQASGELEVPDISTPMQAGWYSLGVVPGEVGPAVIVGHINGAGRSGIFGRLQELKVGDTVNIAQANGRILTFEAYDKLQVPKGAFPTDLVYRNTDGPELRLITCGGQYVAGNSSYSDNVIVFLKLLEL